MLQAIRGRAASWVVKILFVLLIISFAAWGIADYVNSSKVPREVARVGGVKIDPQTLSNAVQVETQRLRQIFGGALDRDQARAFGLVDRALDGLIAQSILEQEARRLGLAVSDAAVRLSIQTDPSFRSPEGQFDINRFRQLLASAGYSEDRFVAETRRDLLRSQLTRPVNEGAHVPEVLLKLLLDYRGERRQASTLAVAQPPAESIATPSDQELADYHQANTAKFTAPEYRSLSYLLLTPADLEAGIVIPEDQLREAYTSRLEELALPEKRTVEQILFADEAAARSAREKIVAGADFLTVAKEDANTEPAAAQLGSFTRRELPSELAETVFALAANAVSEPVKSGFGWHLFRVTGIEEGKTPAFEDTRAALATDMIREKAQDAVFDLSTKLDDLLAGNTPLAEAAQRLGLKLQQVTEVDRNGRAKAGAAATLPQPLLATAAALQAGETSRLSELGNDSYYVVRADSVVPPVLRPLAEIRDEVAAAWQAAKRDAAAKERADAIAAEIKGGKSLADVAAANALTVEAAGPFTREGTGASLPPAAVSALFAGPVGTVAVAPRPDGYVVAQLDQVLPVDPAALAERRPAVTTELRDAIGVDLLTAFQAALRQQIPVQIDRKAIDTLF